MDGMSLKRIRTIIEQLRGERFHVRPSRRIQIPKKSSGTRPLSIPNFTEKPVQEAMRLLLEAYYEPRFRNSSHGFRPGRGCDTALEAIKPTFDGSTRLYPEHLPGRSHPLTHQRLRVYTSGVYRNHAL